MNKKLAIVAGSIVLILLLLYFVFYDSRKPRASVVGNYESVSPDLTDKAKFAIAGIECFYAFRQLKLLADSSFTLIDSTTVSTGNWSEQEDMVELHFLSIRYVNDSLLSKYGKPETPLNEINLNYNNPDLYSYRTNSNGKCVEIFKIKS